MFRAFADRTRSLFGILLRGGELCVCHIVDVLGVPQPTASRHLAYLRRAGLVRAQAGPVELLSAGSPPYALHQKLLDCLACCFQDVPELAQDAKRLAIVRKGCR